MKKWFKRIMICFGAICFVIALFYLIISVYVILNEHDISINPQDETIHVKASETIDEDPEEMIVEDITEPNPEEYATSHINDEEVIQEHTPLTTAPVVPSDVYAELNSVIVYKCYYPEATGYAWETYDAQTDEWIPAPVEDIIERTDELYRRVSTYLVTADEPHKDFLIRCRVSQESGEFITNTASLHILPEISSVFAGEYTSKAGEYVSAKDIPVTITYQDGSQDTITGLNGLHFLSREESSENSTTVSGNEMETITTVITACDYWYLNGETEILLRYRGGGDPIDIPIRLVGQDTTAPIIKELHISDFDISTVDQAIPVVVTIIAEDDTTAYPDLEYAFLPEGEEPQEENWVQKACFDVDITKNGTWIAYCRDKSGNISTEEKSIIAVDNKAPIVDLSLENDTWCRENKIIVNAKDGLSIEYRYTCAETGEDSGWVARNEYGIKANSTWAVMVRDAVGNMTEQEISIDNIDTKAPVIRSIIEKTEGEATANE